MSRFIRPTFIPALFVIAFSAQECDSSVALSSFEEITVHADASIDVTVRQRSDSIGRLLDWDPPPTLEAGWDSVHLGLSGEKRYALRAWNRFPPGADLPETFADPGDPLSEWYVRFPSRLSQEERGDTVFFDYERVYTALDWFPDELFRDLKEDMDRLETPISEAWEELEEKWETLEERYGDSVDLENPETEADSLLARQAFGEVLDAFSEPDSPLLELHRQLAEDSIRVTYLSGVALVAPAVQSLPAAADSHCSGVVMDILQGPLSQIEVTPEEGWKLLTEEWDLEDGLGPFPDVSQVRGAPEFESEVQDCQARALGSVRKALRTECRLPLEDVIMFDRRFEWLTERYRIRGGGVRSQSFELYLALPGELLETNADTVINGRARWKFSLRDLAEDDVVITGRSRVVR